MSRRYKFIDLFAGCGGLSEGFYMEGFEALAHVEIDHVACKTLKTRMQHYGYKNADKAVIEADITSSDIMKVIKKAGGKTLTNIEVFDVYEGKNIEEGKRSIAFSLKFEDYCKTLTDEEVSLTFNNVISEVEKKYNAVLRDN